MSESTEKGKKRKKSYYIQGSKRGNRLELGAGMKGFFITCNNNERFCVRDAYNLLNEFALKLYGPENTAQDPSEEKDEDVESLLKKELNSLREEKHTERRFQSVDTRSRNCIFIKTQLPDPTEIVDAIIGEILESHRQCSRYILRLLPIQVTCKPILEDICKAAEPLLQTYFGNTEVSRESEKPKTFAVLFKARNNKTVHRNNTIEELAKIIHRQNEHCKADLNSPDMAVIVEVVCKVCCLSVVKKYFSYQKYNLAEMSGNGKVQLAPVESGQEVAEVKCDE